VTGADPGPVLALQFARDTAGEVLLAGLHRNGVVSAATPFDDWTPANDGLQARLLLSLAVSPAFDSDQTMYAAGPDDGVLRSSDAGRTWSAHLTEVADPPVFSIVVSPAFVEDHALFAATDAGLLRSRDAGTTWSVATGDGAVGTVFAAPQRVIAAIAGGRVVESGADAETWRALGADFAADIVSMTCAPDGTLFVGTSAADQLTLWRCAHDGGRRERWLVERGSGLLPLAVSPTYGVDDMVYVGVGSRVLSPMHRTRELRAGERRPLWRGADLGATVTALATATDYQGRRTVVAATSAGVYVSHDAGASFAPWRDGDGPAATVAIVLSSSYANDGMVYALEVGGTIWRRRDADFT
jgi:photosystem II stability/assembly factor-like uncharacterized protein